MKTEIKDLAGGIMAVGAAISWTAMCAVIADIIH